MSTTIERMFRDPERQNQIFPVTHERAVRDDDGTTLESKLEDMHSENAQVVQQARAAAEQVVESAGIIFDISKYNAVGNTLTPYADLDTALSGVPQDYHMPGMTIRFIDSTTSKYVQYRLTATAWSTNSSDWAKEDTFTTGQNVNSIGVDSEPTAGSRNLVESGGVVSYIDNTYHFRYFTGKGSSFVRGVGFKVIPGHIYRVVLRNTSWNYGTTNTSATVFEIAYSSDGENFTTLVFSRYAESLVLNRYYDVVIPSNVSEDVMLYVGGRAATGNKIWFAIDDLTYLNFEKERAIVTENNLAENDAREDLFLFGQGIESIVGYVSSTNGPHRVYDDDSEYCLVKVRSGDKITVSANTYSYCIFASRTVNGTSELYTYATGYSGFIQTKPKDITVPSDGVWLYVRKSYNGTSDNVKEISINGIDVLSTNLIDIVSNVAPIPSQVEALDIQVNGPAWKKSAYKGYWNGTKWASYNVGTLYTFYVIPVKNSDVIQFISNSARHNVLSAFEPTFITGTKVCTTGTIITLSADSRDSNNNAPSWNVSGTRTWTMGTDGKYFMFYTVFNGVTHSSTIIINGVEVWPAPEGLEPKIDDLENRVSALEGDDSIVSLNGGLTYLTEALSNIKKPKGNSASSFGNDILTLLYFSDLHYTSGTSSVLERILGFNETFSTYIDDMLHGGDTVDDQFQDTNPFDDNVMEGGSAVLNVIGNHDNWDVGNVEGDSVNGRVLPTKVFAKFIRDYAEGWRVTLPDDAEENGYCYWYKDYSNSKVRLIALNCMVWDSTQADWLSRVLDGAITNGYHVIIVNHYTPHSSYQSIRTCTFSTVYSSGTSAVLNSEAAQIVHSKITNGITVGGVTVKLNFICWLFGHYHEDLFGNLADYPEQYAIAIDKPVPNSNWERDSKRLTTGKSQDAFDIISVDTTLGILSVMRIGNNRDKFMRQKNFLAFDYVNHEIVGNS